MIESSANGQYKKIQRLMKQSRARRQEGVFVVEGWKMVKEALRRGLVLQLYIAESGFGRCEEELAAEAVERPVLETMSDALFRQLSDTVNPQGILGIVRMPVYDRREILAGSEVKLLCLEDIQDPGNLGTMIRTAEGAGMSGIVLSKGCVDLFNPKVVRSTMGSLFRVPFYSCDDLAEEMSYLQSLNFHFYAAHLQAKRSFQEETYEGRMGILIGNEANGLSPKATEQADSLVKIPMAGELESLNAAISAALLMYEVRRTSTKPPSSSHEGILD